MLFFVFLRYSHFVFRIWPSWLVRREPAAIQVYIQTVPKKNTCESMYFAVPLSPSLLQLKYKINVLGKVIVLSENEGQSCVTLKHRQNYVMRQECSGTFRCWNIKPLKLRQIKLCIFT